MDELKTELDSAVSDELRNALQRAFSHENEELNKAIPSKEDIAKEYCDLFLPGDYLKLVQELQIKSYSVDVGVIVSKICHLVKQCQQFVDLLVKNLLEEIIQEYQIMNEKTALRALKETAKEQYKDAIYPSYNDMAKTVTSTLEFPESFNRFTSDILRLLWLGFVISSEDTKLSEETQLPLNDSVRVYEECLFSSRDLERTDLMVRTLRPGIILDHEILVETSVWIGHCFLPQLPSVVPPDTPLRLQNSIYNKSIKLTLMGFPVVYFEKNSQYFNRQEINWVWTSFELTADLILEADLIENDCRTQIMTSRVPLRYVRFGDKICVLTKVLKGDEIEISLQNSTGRTFFWCTLTIPDLVLGEF